MNKENVLSVAASGTISLIEKYEIHSHPDEKYYNYGEFYSIVFRKKKGIMSDIYNVVERLKISQKNFNNIKEVVNNNIYSDRIEMYIKERLNKFGFSSENDYIFYVLKKDRILSHNPRVEKNTQNHMWIDKNELISGKDIVESVKLGGKNTTKVEFTGFPIVNAKINPNFDEKENKNEIISKMRNKLESIGFVFEKEQQSYMQKREFKELKFTHQVLINQFLEDGIKTNAQKFYLKALSNSKEYEIGFVTGKSSPLSKIENFPKPNALDSYDGNPAWTNREDDRAFDKLVKAINDYLTLKKASINTTAETSQNKVSKVVYTGYWTFFCNPKYWQIDDFLNNLKSGIQLKTDTWRIADWQKDKFSIGDYGVIRVGVDNRTKKELKKREKLTPGVYAIVKVIELPNENKEENENYWNTNEVKEKRQLSVKIEFVENFIDSPIYLKDIMREDKIKLDKYLVNGFQASSMPLIKDSFDKIVEIAKASIYSRENLISDFDIEKINLDYSEIGETEKESIIKSRLVQDKFKKKLKKIDNSCKLCKLNIEELLIASHIKPWKDSANKERIDIFNGFLLCPTHDKLFDIGLISFEDNGEIIISDEIEEKNYEKLNIKKGMKIEINDGNKKYLKWHRENILKN